MRQRIYNEAPAVAFAVRVQRKHQDTIKAVATRLGVSEVEAKRLIVDAGLKALQAA